MTLKYAPYGSGGSCPYCRSTNTGTSPNGVNVCFDCGRSGW
jgi:hypothetical protein